MTENTNRPDALADARHAFVPMTSNRTRCDVCGRTVGVRTHRDADPIVDRNPWGGQPYQGVDYPKGATFRLDDRRVRIVAVGRAGNYVVQDLDGNRPNASVHHSSLVAIPCSYDDGGDYCYSHDRRDDHRPDGRPVVNGYGFPA